ncbi:MAG TPA: hypothetical protein VK563_22215 [Puia sp.]|nr:hypothetical protein [Puia sp.]
MTNLQTKAAIKIGAQISLIVVLLLTCSQFIPIYRAKYQLTSPLIPAGVVQKVIEPAIFEACITSIVSLVGLILYFFEKHLLVIILAGLTIIGLQILPYLYY